MTSRLEPPKWERLLDQRSPTVRQSRQRKIEHRAENRHRKGALGAECVSTRIECSGSLGPVACAGGRGDSA